MIFVLSVLNCFLYGGRDSSCNFSAGKFSPAEAAEFSFAETGRNMRAL